MLSSPRIMIVSAYGRGHWLAVELQRLGYNVQLVDVTERLGQKSKADQDGPFGYFLAPHWIGVEANALDSFGATEECPQGFNLWLKNGPWELRSSTTKYRGEAMKLSARSMEFVRQYNDYLLDRRPWIERLKAQSFDRRWISSLAADFMATRSQWPDEAFFQSAPAALFEKYFSRPPENFDLAASLKWCVEQGVIVVDHAEIPDIAIEHRRIQGIEISGQKSGFVRCHQLVWLLNSMETEMFSPRAFDKLYSGNVIEPEWCWLRYEVEIKKNRESEQLPREFLLLEELSIPWAHDNFAIFRRGGDPKIFHVWLRIPFSQRFHREYLNDRIQPVLQNLSARCPRLKAEVRALPQEAHQSSQDLGAPLFPIYRRPDLASPPGLHIKNLWFNHAERWPSFSWDHIFASQRHIISHLRQWWGDLSDEQKQKELET